MTEILNSISICSDYIKLIKMKSFIPSPLLSNRTTKLLNILNKLPQMLQKCYK